MAQSDGKMKDLEATEALISQVCLKDLIYNKKNKDHMKSNLVDVAFEQIGEAIGRDPQWCKKRWENLRRCYRTALEKEDKPSGSAGPARGRKKFPFLQQMSFLHDHVVKKKSTISNFTEPNVTEPLEVPQSFDHFSGSPDPFQGLQESSESLRGFPVSSTSKKGMDENRVDLEREFDLPDSPKAGCSYATKRRLDDTTEADNGDDTLGINFDESDENRPSVKKSKRSPLKRVNFPNINDSLSDAFGSDDGMITPGPVKRVKKQRKSRKTTKTGNLNETSTGERTEQQSTDFFRSVTAAANSITGMNYRSNAPLSNAEGMIDGFCDMQRYMLRTLNEDARLQYIREQTAKLTELCALEKHIL